MEKTRYEKNISDGERLRRRKQ